MIKNIVEGFYKVSHFLLRKGEKGVLSIRSLAKNGIIQQVTQAIDAHQTHKYLCVDDVLIHKKACFAHFEKTREATQKAVDLDKRLQQFYNLVLNNLQVKAFSFEQKVRWSFAKSLRLQPDQGTKLPHPVQIQTVPNN